MASGLGWCGYMCGWGPGVRCRECLGGWVPTQFTHHYQQDVLKHYGAPSNNPSHPTTLTYHPTTTNKQDVLKYYGATKYGSGPPPLGERSPRESFNPEAEAFLRERGSYQNPPEHP